MTTLKRLDLLIREVRDPYAQENFLKIKAYFDQIEKTLDQLANDSVAGDSDVDVDEFGWYFIPADVSLVVDIYRQFLFNGPLTIEGSLEIIGQAVEVD